MRPLSAGSNENQLAFEAENSARFAGAAYLLATMKDATTHGAKHRTRGTSTGSPARDC